MEVVIREEQPFSSEEQQLKELPSQKSRKMFANSIQLSGHDSEVYCTKFSHCGNYLASAGNDKQILLWDVFDEKFSNLISIKGHNNAVLDLCWGIDGNNLYSCGADRTVCVWDVNSAERIRKLRGHESIVNSVDVSRRGSEFIVSGSDDCTIKIWDVRERDHVNEWKLKHQVTCVAVNNTNEYIYFGGVDNQIKAWNLRKNEIEYSLIGHTETITGISLSHNGKYLLSNAMDHFCKAWDIQPFVSGSRFIKNFIGGTHNFERNLLRCCWNKDDSHVSAGSADRFAYVWNFDSGLIAHRLGGHSGSVNETHFHPEEHILASCSTDRTLFVGEIAI